MPIRDRDDATQVADRFQRFFRADSEQRPGILRALFTEILDFDRESSQLSLVQAPGRAGIELPDAAERIATLGGVEVLYVDLSSGDTATERVRKAEVLAVTTVVRDALREDMLLLFSNRSGDQLHWIHPKFSGGSTPTLRRIVLERGIQQRTAIQQLSNIYWNHQDSGNILDAVNEAFNVDKVTKDFFREYKRIFEQAEGLISGFSDPEDRKQFVQTLFNRLMFVYFLSRKGWLKYEGETDYINTLWDAYADHATQNNFYNDRLTFLFFQGLNNPDSRDLRGGVDFLIGDVPFLNGGLFEETEIDRRGDITVPDDAIRPLMTDLFDKFNFTVMESTPFDIEVAVDPEMLGKVFEELVTGRHDSGAYYTPRPVVSFMCREALKGYLEGALTPALSQGEREQTAAAVARFVDDHDASGISISQATAIQQALEAVTVVDPACGSGAYLVGMMQELVDLRVELYNQKLKQDARSLYELKLHIIERNLYGVDIDQFAVDIARLRLWLSLAIDYEGGQPEPLPNLDFKIVQGDSLLGPDPSQLNLDRHAIQQSGLADLKGQYMRETNGDAKERLKEDILRVEEQLRTTLALGDVPDQAIDWRIKFAEVVGLGGFDIAIANPPYISFPKNKELSAYYSQCDFETYAKTGDIYQLFYERGCQLLRSPNALLVFITSNSWLRAPYGKKTRQLLSNWHRPLRYIDLGKDVFDTAIVDSGIVFLRTGIIDAGPKPFPSVDMDMLSDVNFPPPADQWGETEHNGDAPWSLLSKVEKSVMEKTLSVGVRLKDWDVKINRGIVTGYNEAFIIDTPTRDRLVAEDPQSAEILKRVLRGRDIKPYKAKWNGFWLLCTFPSQALDIDDFPAVKEHLLSFGKERLEQSGKSLVSGGKSRKKTNNAWFETQDANAYHAEYKKENILWMDMASSASFAYSEDEIFTNNAVYMIVGENLKYLAGILNSGISIWYMRHTARTTGLGLTIWHKVYTEQIPVPESNERSRSNIINLVDQILDAKDADPDADTSDLEREIDRLVYDLYGLTEEEIAAVERRVGVGRG